MKFKLKKGDMNLKRIMEQKIKVINWIWMNLHKKLL